MSKTNTFILSRPIVSEKSTMQIEATRTYAFKVMPSANKQQIRESVEHFFNVKVEKVRTMIVHGKYKRAGRFVAKKANWKKALVTLKEGQKIEIFQGA